MGKPHLQEILGNTVKMEKKSGHPMDRQSQVGKVWSRSLV